MGLVAKLWLSVGSEEIRCQFDKTVCLISELLSLYLSEITKGFVFLWDFDVSIVCLSSNWIEFIWSLISVAL